MERIAALYAALGAAEPASPTHTMATAQFSAALNTIDAERGAQARHPDLLHPAAAKVLATLDREWAGLARHREFPELPLDNNTSERALRGPVIGRKNYYGSGSVVSAQRALGGVVVQRQFGVLAVSGQAFPFPVQGGEHLGRGRVQAGQRGLGFAFGVDAGQRGAELRGRVAVRAAVRRGGGHRGVRAVERGDALHPGLGPGRQLGVRVAGADEVAADVGLIPMSG